MKTYNVSKELIDELLKVLANNSFIDLGSGEEDNNYEVLNIIEKLNLLIKCQE
jgi:hypothetical protein